MVHAFNPSTQEAKTGISLSVLSHCGLPSEFQNSQACFSVTRKEECNFNFLKTYF